MKPLIAIVAIATAIGGCGSSKPVARLAGGGQVVADAAVVRSWAEALAAGRIDAAANYFALPATVQNGTPELRLTTRSLVRAFNASLPCGARLISARPIGRYTVVTFRLIDRPGGSCGRGRGGLAATAFVIRGSKIAEWRRTTVPGGPTPRPGAGALAS